MGKGNGGHAYKHWHTHTHSCGRARAESDGTRAETHFVFRLNGRVHLNRRRSQFSRMLAAEVRASALVMLDTPRSEVA